MSVDETNALRAKLGLAPLRQGPAREIRDGAKEREEKRRVAETADLKAKVEARKRQREVDALNASTAKLGDVDDARDDDARAWLAKSRGSMANKAKDLERQKAAKMAAMFAARDEDAEASDEEGDEAGGGERKAEYTSKDLRGLRVRHDADEMVEGQEVVLTLKDASVLDDGEDELENVLMAERKSRKKARLAATKRTDADDPFGEKADEEKKTLLSKYDDKADGDGMELDGDGGLDAAEERRKADIKARLAAEAAGLRGKLDTAEVIKGEQADFHTREEMQAKFVKREKKKKMRKKLRKKHVDAAELEGDALAPESQDHGSRRSRENRGVEDEGATNEKNSKFANALQKAREVTDKKILAELAGDVEEEEDDELARALARSRNMANKAARSAPEDVVAQVAARRAADAARAEAAAPELPDESLVFTDMSEFVQGIDARRGEEDEDDEDDAEANEMPDAPPSPPPPPPMGDDDEEMPDVPPPPPPPGAEEDAPVSEAPVLAEKHIVKQGLASTLALLKEKAQLDDANSTRWSGRANDLKDRFDKQHVLEAHAADDAVVDGYKFGFKLDRFDEFGRKLTPKEAFRELCHRFHGIEPGKMKREKRLRQYQEEQQRLAASSVIDERVKNVQREHAVPYVVLSGNVRAGQSKQADPLATAARERLATERTAPPKPSIDPSSVAASNASKVSFAMKPPTTKK